MHRTIRNQIVEILKAHPAVMTLAARQRARFEGWLKFELAARLVDEGATAVSVESAYEEAKSRADVAFTVAPDKFVLELKTPSTNWRTKGVENKHKAITKAVAGIISDAVRLKSCPGTGLVAFVLLPLPEGDSRWNEYLSRISQQSGLNVSEQEHCSRVPLHLGPGRSCEAIVCCFPVLSSAKG